MTDCFKCRLDQPVASVSDEAGKSNTNVSNDDDDMEVCAIGVTLCDKCRQEGYSFENDCPGVTEEVVLLKMENGVKVKIDWFSKIFSKN